MNHTSQRLFVIVVLPGLLLALAGSLSFFNVTPVAVLIVQILLAVGLAAGLTTYLHQRLIQPLHRIQAVLEAFSANPAQSIQLAADLREREDEMGRLAGTAARLQDIFRQREAVYREEIQALETSLKEEKAQSLTKSRLVADMSHELHTPLNAVIDYSEILHDEAIQVGAGNLLPYLHKIRVSGEHLLSLLNNVLDFAKIEAGKMSLQPEIFRVDRLLEQVAATIQPLAEKNRNVLEIAPTAETGTMYTDLTKLKQILLNLLGNACKFTQKGKIILRAERSQDKKGKSWVVFSVRDTGVGINENEQNRLLEAFSKDKGYVVQQGIGLGLAISRHFAELMGGSLQLRSRTGEGTVIVVRLPAEAPGTAQLARIAPPYAVADSEGQYTVLVIDDEPAARELIHKSLVKMGHRVSAAMQGEEGVRLARGLHPHLVILDVVLPRIDGWMVLSVLKNDATLRKIPVIMLCNPEEQRIAQSMGASDYLIKPLSQERLAAVVHRYLPRPEGQPDAAEYLLNPVAAPAQSPDNPRVMLVEDDLTTREMMTTILQRAGWGVITAENGRVALEKIAADKPDLILLDLMMPEMDGFEFAARLRANPDCASLPVVVLTAKDIGNEDRLLLKDKVQAIFQKGAQSRHQLLEELREILNVAYSSSFLH